MLFFSLQCSSNLRLLLFATYYYLVIWVYFKCLAPRNSYPTLSYMYLQAFCCVLLSWFSLRFEGSISHGTPRGSQDPKSSLSVNLVSDDMIRRSPRSTSSGPHADHSPAVRGQSHTPQQQQSLSDYGQLFMDQQRQVRPDTMGFGIWHQYTTNTLYIQ